MFKTKTGVEYNKGIAEDFHRVSGRLNNLNEGVEAGNLPDAVVYPLISSSSLGIVMEVGDYQLVLREVNCLIDQWTWFPMVDNEGVKGEDESQYSDFYTVLDEAMRWLYNEVSNRKAELEKEAEYLTRVRNGVSEARHKLI